MEIEEVIDKARDAVTVRRVFGEPIERGGTVMVPAARVRGAAGGGKGEAPEQGAGSGSGFAITAVPAGAFVFKDGDVRWRPAINVNRVIMGGQIAFCVAALAVAAIFRRKRR